MRNEPLISDMCWMFRRPWAPLPWRVKTSHLPVFSRTAPECTTVSTCTPWRALWLTSCAPSRILWKVRLPLPFLCALRGVGGGSWRSDHVRRRGPSGSVQVAPLLPEPCWFSTQQLIFSPAQSFILLPPAAHLRDLPAPDPAATWPEQQLELTRGDTMALLTSPLSSVSLHCRCEQSHKQGGHRKKQHGYSNTSLNHHGYW